MDGSMFRNMFRDMAIFFIAVGFVAGFVLFIAAPWAWGFIKPIIHALTA